MSDYQEYVKALDLMDQVKTATDPLQAWDDLYTFLHTNFPEPETAYKPYGQDRWTTNWNEVKQHLESQDIMLMFKQDREQIVAKLRSIPPVILAVTFPVWIARYLLRFVGVPISPNNISTFDEFHRRYGRMIIAGAY